MSIALSQTTLEQVVDMMLDKTAMQIKDKTYAVTTAGKDLDGFDGTGGSSTSGGLTTVEASTGIITVGRTGIFRLRICGSMESSGAAEMEIRIHLDTGSGFGATGFEVYCDVGITDHNSFAIEFHGTRSAGDKIKAVMFSDGTDNFIFNSISVMTEWMS